MGFFSQKPVTGKPLTGSTAVHPGWLQPSTSVSSRGPGCTWAGQQSNTFGCFLLIPKHVGVWSGATSSDRTWSWGPTPRSNPALLPVMPTPS
jgi:hypothetical protein